MFVINGCDGEDESMYYDISDISELSYELADDSLAISYSLPLETLYYSPGIDLKVNGDDVIINIVRCSINDKCSVDLVTTRSDDNRQVASVRKQVEPSRVYINRISPETSVDRLARK